MLKEEFEKLTNLIVTDDEYVNIDALYMASGDSLDKAEFCKMYMSFDGRLELLHRIERERNHKEQMYLRLKKEIGEMLEEEEQHKLEMADFLLAEAAFHMCGSLTAKRLRDKAVELVGETSVVRMKIEHGYDLWQDDKDYILRNMR